MIPVRPGRDMASILEVAARNELLKNAGHHAAREFFGNLEGALLGSEQLGVSEGRRDRRESVGDESAVLPPVSVKHHARPGRPAPPPPSSGAAAPPPPPPPRPRHDAPARTERSAPVPPESEAGDPKAAFSLEPSSGRGKPRSHG